MYQIFTSIDIGIASWNQFYLFQKKRPLVLLNMISSITHVKCNHIKVWSMWTLRWFPNINLFNSLREATFEKMLLMWNACCCWYQLLTDRRETDRREGCVSFSVCFIQGIARTQSPTNINYAPESSTFGKIAKVKRSGVQWNILALGEPPCGSGYLLRQVSMLVHCHVSVLVPNQHVEFHLCKLTHTTLATFINSACTLHCTTFVSCKMGH